MLYLGHLTVYRQQHCNTFKDAHAGYVRSSGKKRIVIPSLQAFMKAFRMFPP